MPKRTSRREFVSQTALGALAASPAAALHGAEAGPAAGESDNGPLVSWRRSVPLRYEADVAVIGGGIAGVSAACSAAKSGAKVILVERFGVTGGVLTTGGVANFCGQLHGQGEVFDRILADLKAFRAIGTERESVFHYEILAIVLQEMLLRRGVKLLLHTRFVDARSSNHRITECIVCGMSGPEAVRAKQFIDCSGESVLGRAAGCEVMKGGRPSKYQLPMSMMFFVRHVSAKDMHAHLPRGWFNPITSRGDLPMTSVWPDGPGGNAIKIKIPMFDSTDTESLTAAEIQGRRRMMEVMDYFQRVEEKPWLLDHCSPIIGVREGCRIAGEYVLTVDDLRAGRAFDDGVARGTFYLDGHKPDDDKRTYILPKDELDVPPYQIPLRSLIARDSRNLMMAGRNLSADQLALSSARVSTTGSMMGQAAGITAAMCAQRGCDPKSLDAREVRKVLEKRGAQLDV
jgi:hypothetical protein